MKVQYFTDKENIEDNALKCLEHFEQESNIEKITVFPDIHYCSEKARLNDNLVSHIHIHRYSIVEFDNIKKLYIKFVYT